MKQCLIGYDDIIVKCIMKTSEMIKQVCAAASSGIGTKITIENFQKRENAIFTSHLSAIELDTQVKYEFSTERNNSPNIYISMKITILMS